MTDDKQATAPEAVKDIKAIRIGERVVQIKEIPRLRIGDWVSLEEELGLKLADFEDRTKIGFKVQFRIACLALQRHDKSITNEEVSDLDLDQIAAVVIATFEKRRSSDFTERSTS